MKNWPKPMSRLCCASGAGRAARSKRLLAHFGTPANALQKRRLEMLAWLVRDGWLDVRVGVMRHGGGILHAKFGLFTDARWRRRRVCRQWQRERQRELREQLRDPGNQPELATTPSARALSRRVRSAVGREPTRLWPPCLPEAVGDHLIKFAPECVRQSRKAKTTCSAGRAAMLWAYALAGAVHARGRRRDLRCHGAGDSVAASATRRQRGRGCLAGRSAAVRRSRHGQDGGGHPGPSPSPCRPRRQTGADPAAGQSAAPVAGRTARERRIACAASGRATTLVWPDGTKTSCRRTCGRAGAGHSVAEPRDGANGRRTSRRCCSAKHMGPCRSWTKATPRVAPARSRASSTAPRCCSGSCGGSRRAARRGVS